MKNPLLFLCIYLSFCSTAQTKQIDSLKLALKTAKEDTNKINVLNKLSLKLYYIPNYDSSLVYAKQAIALSSSLPFRQGKGWAKGIAQASNIIGFICLHQGNYPEALKNYFSVSKIREEFNDKEGIADSYNNIGNVYYRQGNFIDALKSHFTALKIRVEIKDQRGRANSHNNIGNVYASQANYPEALKNYFAALRIREETNDKKGTADSYNNIGIVYSKQGDYSEALKNQLLALNIHEVLKDKAGIAASFTNIGATYLELKNYKEAKVYSTKALGLAKEIGHLEIIKEASQALCAIYASTGRHKEALEYYKAYITARDSLVNEENTKKTVQQSMQYEFDKKESATKLEQEKKDAIADAESRKQKIVIAAISIGLLLVLVLALVVFRNLRINKKKNLIIQSQKEAVEKQKELVDEKNKIVEEQKLHIEEKHKEITDSINYAQRIQKAILPPPEYINQYIPYNLVLYKPKDIVAGDFYWMETIEDLIFIAAADSTGHGVPGAMVSVVCSNALDRSLKEFKETHTGKILDKTRQLVVDTFAKSSADVKDGMDISLLCIDNKNKRVFWSGANNSLWYIQENQLTEIKADKQSIGKTDNPKPFTTHKIEYKKNTTFYLFTDGFADQFGGPKGKKFKYKQFSDLLLNINHLPLEQQAQLINESFENWRGSLEQVDDVCVLGIKL
ncbi:MAG: tetratricopeptide repeat protein [Bacteroidetes bacterium]|nr:tetratricopeptide repeat protein [Bacteroidota bacterium]